MTISDFLCVDDSIAATEFWVTRRMAIELRRQQRESLERYFGLRPLREEDIDEDAPRFSLLEDSELIQ